MEITPSEWAKMHARIYDIEIWKARKEVVDETRHEQNQLELKRANSRIDETHTVSMGMGKNSTRFCCARPDKMPKKKFGTG